MPTQRDMNSSIRWKRQAGEPMGEKKNRERFSIKFNENCLLYTSTAEGTEENALDGFLPVTGPVPDNPVENGTEQADRLPVMGESAEAGEPVETEEENACPEEDAGEEGESEEKETDATESDAEKESEDKKRAEHEAAEARRKAEWETKRQEKQAIRQAQLDRIKACLLYTSRCV